MEVAHFEKNNVIVVTLEGELNNSTSFKVNQYFKPLMEGLKNQKKTKALILEVSGIKTVDSSGLGLLCGKCVKVKKMGKIYGLADPSPAVTHMINLCNLGHVFPVYASATSAVNTLGSLNVVEKKIEEQPKKRKPKAVANGGKSLDTFSQHNKRSHL